MPQWVELFQNHPVHEQLRAFGSKLAEIEEDENEEPTPEITESLERLKLISNYAKKVFGTLDPFLTPRAALDNINSYLQQATSYCDQYKNDGNAAHLESANGQAEGVLLQLGSIPSIRSNEELEGLSEGIVSFRRSVGQYQRYVSDEREGIEARVEQAKEQLDGVSNNITAQQTRLDEVVSEFQRQFSESEERRRTEFAETEKDQENRFREGEENRATEFRQFVEEQSAQSEKHLEDILSQKERADELVYVISNTGMVGGYQKIANDERRVAFRWQVVAVVAFIGLIAFAVFAFVATLGGSVSWQAFGARLFVAVTFGILAAYAASQADRHEYVERTSRRLELALASVDPYLVSLPEETRHEVKQALAMKFFGETPETDQNTPEVNGTSADLLRMALETINEFARRSSGSP